MSDLKRVSFVSLGCAKNLVDSEKMLGQLAEAGCAITADEDNADVTVINTCGFLEASRTEADEVIRDAVARKTNGVLKRVVVAGCLVQRDKEAILERIPGGRCGQALDSMVCPGSVMSGGVVERSIVGPSCRVNSFAVVEDSILFEGVDVGRHAQVRRAIIDKGVQIPAGARIGFDPVEDQRRGFTMSDKGVVVIAKTAASEALFDT
jgi:hypothetical protein